MKIPPYIGYPVLVALFIGAVYVIANRQIFHPMKYPDGWWENQSAVGAEDVWIESDGTKLHGWWVDAPDARLVTLYLHGNAGNVSHRASHLIAVRDAGSSILVIDYRGYGRSSGKPSEAGMYADAGAAYQFLRDRGYRPEQIVVHGESLGTSVAVELATRVPIAGLVLEAPFTSAGDVAHRILPYLGRLVVRSFNTKARIREISAPLLVIHGKADEIIAFDMGRELYAIAPEPKSFWLIPGAGHNNIVEAAGPEYSERLRRFYVTLL